MKKQLLIICLSVFTSALTIGCGKNVASSFSESSTKEKAEDAIVKSDYNGAIDLLTQYTRDNPNDTMAMSMLANAYMLRGGIDMGNIMAAIQKELGKASNDFYAILRGFPSSSQNNLEDVATGLALIRTIPQASMSQAQIFQVAVANIASSILLIKKNCLDASGTISTAQIYLAPPADVNSIYDNLIGSLAAFQALGVVGGSSAPLSVVVDTVDQIKTSPGNSNAEKLMNFLATKT